MPGIGDLVVNLSANTRKLTSGLDTGTSRLKAFAASAKTFLNPLTVGLAAVTGAAVGAGVAIYGLTSTIDKLDKVAKDAARTGVSGAFLQQLTFAADQSGVSVEQLTIGIKKLSIAIGKGDDKPFAAIGLSLSELQALNPEQQFLRVAEAMSKIETTAKRNTAAIALFGKAGVEMTTLFGGGMTGINKLMERARELSIGVSAAGLDKIQAANDALGQMKASFGALVDQITVGLAPAFTMVATAIADTIPPITKFLDKFNELATPDKFKAIGDLFEAGMLVAFAAIGAAWETTLNEMIAKAAVATLKLNPVNLATVHLQGLGSGVAKMFGAEPVQVAPGESKLEAALRNFSDKASNFGMAAQWDAPANVIGADPSGGAQWDAPANVIGADLLSAQWDAPENVIGADPVKKQLQTLTERLAEQAGGPNMLDALLGAANVKLTDMKIKGGFLGSVVKGMFTGFGVEGDRQKQIEPRVAGAMQRGSAEAFSAIVNAQMRTKDPNVKATEKQTKELIEAWKKNKPQVMMAMGAVMP